METVAGLGLLGMRRRKGKPRMNGVSVRGRRGEGRGGALISGLSIPAGRGPTFWQSRLGAVALETPLDPQVEAPLSRRRDKSGIREGGSELAYEFSIRGI